MDMRQIIILLIRDMVVESCYRQFGRKTIHPTQKFTSMNLLQMSCVITQAKLFLTSEVMEAVGGQKHPSEAKKGMKSCSTTSKTSQRIQSDLSYDLRQERYSDLRGHSMYIAVVFTQLLGGRAQKPSKRDSQCIMIKVIKYKVNYLRKSITERVFE